MAKCKALTRSAVKGLKGAQSRKLRIGPFFSFRPFHPISLPFLPLLIPHLPYPSLSSLLVFPLLSFLVSTHLKWPPQSSRGIWTAMEERCKLPSGSSHSSADKRFLQVDSELKITVWWIVIALLQRFSNNRKTKFLQLLTLICISLERRSPSKYATKSNISLLLGRGHVRRPTTLY